MELFLLSALARGAVYSLLALGFVLLQRVFGIWSLAQADLGMIAALLVAALTLTVGLPLGLGALAGLAVVVVAFVAVSWAPFRRDLVPGASLLLTIGLALAARGLAAATWGDLPLALGLFEVDEPPLAVPPRVAQLGLVVALAAGLIVCLQLFLRHTIVGRRLLGSRLTLGARSVTLGWAGLLAAAAGLLLTTISPLETAVGTSALFPALAGVLVGGNGSLRGAVGGSLLVAVWEGSVAVLWPSLAGVSVLALLLGALLLMPVGLLGRLPAR
ncbi:MAG: hypothetical protein HYY05_08805 [Chloroflexi bacterium]|nr:hypothetical protein [Chloroflexota bacterium]